jgi:uncharacterized protein
VRIRYLNGNRLYHAVLAGGVAVIRDQDYLNKINVFPVPDADTGTNLASTMRAIAEGSQSHLSIKATLKSIAMAALSGARGNSGLIFAQFILGMSKEIGHEPRLTTRAFGESVKRASQHARMAIVHPVEGTMITVIRDWAEAVYQMREKTTDFAELMTETFKAAQTSLRETTQKLQVLAKAGVVDAGAKGFVDFLEGILHFIKAGRISRGEEVELAPAHEEIRTPAKDKSLDFRYCTEALITGKALDPDVIRGLVQRHGDSAVVAGSEERVRIHIHTNEPAELFFRVRDLGTIAQIKVDDMLRQYEAAHQRKTAIGFLTDSSSDLPSGFLDDRQIHVIPFTLSFGDQQYLDRLTITPDRFYQLLRTHPSHPKTAQPGYQTVLQMVTYLAGHYESLIVVTIGDKLTGFYGQCKAAAEELTGKRITVINSRGLSAGLGMLVARASDMALAGASHEAIAAALESWVPKTTLLVDVNTMKYFVRGGRVSPVKGLLGRLLHIKPIITLNEEGKAADAGKSFSRASNMAKILKACEAFTAANGLWNYAVVHALAPGRAEIYAGKLTARLGRPPLFINDVAPVIGVHAGDGTVAVALLGE